MYTPEMATAFHSIVAPPNFGVVLIDNEDYLTVQIDPEQLVNLTEDEKPAVVQYVQDVKEALEDNGAVVLLVREAIEEA